MAKSQTTTDHTEGRVLAILDGRPCPSDDCDGDLERGTYKDNKAVVCEDCGTPQAQVWAPSS
ncbi:hypothetical protein G6M89_12610 [Natronolimnobius sp. AArcel1]|uniref:HVO_A0556 family zinc finger protein n=1 Tax=Natronolimnobius sp. AArcel1 TaxID=1679093 RepID=UPI0013EBCE03|nr:HVO_A0556 family zinc finger protein [Natronolimnobius sp. AArcel1]NGM69839.1 hypothetical protein [Natronolimnobius sp. AArcel1]